MPIITILLEQNCIFIIYNIEKNNKIYDDGKQEVISWFCCMIGFLNVHVVHKGPKGWNWNIFPAGAALVTIFRLLLLSDAMVYVWFIIDPSMVAFCVAWIFGAVIVPVEVIFPELIVPLVMLHCIRCT